MWSLSRKKHEWEWDRKVRVFFWAVEAKRGFQSTEEDDVTAADAPMCECATNLKTLEIFYPPNSLSVFTKCVYQDRVHKNLTNVSFVLYKRMYIPEEEKLKFHHFQHTHIYIN